VAERRRRQRIGGGDDPLNASRVRALSPSRLTRAAPKRLGDEQETGAPSAARAGARDVRTRVVVAGLGLAGAAVVVQTTVHLVNVVALGDRWGSLNADADSGPFMWMSTVTTFAVALVAFLVALTGWRVRLLISVAMVASVLSLDDTLVLHERLGLEAAATLGLTADYARVLWPALYLPALGLIVVALALVARAATSAVRTLLIAGLGFLMLAVVAEMSSVALVETGMYASAAVSYQLEVAFEEAAEIAGWILLATGLTRLWVDRATGAANPARL
jgi:hypothetical protein